MATRIVDAGTFFTADDVTALAESLTEKLTAGRWAHGMARKEILDHLEEAMCILVEMRPFDPPGSEGDRLRAQYDALEIELTNGEVDYVEGNKRLALIATAIREA